MELETDLDLSGSGFTSIPVFCGTFHGNGHKITHFYHTQRGSQAGLFRRIEAGAVVSDLTVEDAVLSPRAPAPMLESWPDRTAAPLSTAPSPARWRARARWADWPVSMEPAV